MEIKIRETKGRCDFEHVPPGTYAIGSIHDENVNGRLDTTWLGNPTVGYAFSDNATALLGAPSFSAVGFPYDGRDVYLTLSLQY